MKKILLWLVVVGVFAPALSVMGLSMLGVSILNLGGAAPEIAKRAPLIMDRGATDANNYLDSLNMPAPAH